MRVKITILVENKVKRLPFGAVGRHGLSMLIEFDDGFKLLYDTGPSWETLLHNASLLGRAIKDVSMIAISHGHHDHGNDLIPLLDYIGRSHLPVVVHPKAFDKKADIKMNSTKDAIKDMEADLILISEPTEIREGVWYSGTVPRMEGNPIHPVRDEATGEIIDEVLDDTALYLFSSEGGIILTGCGHSGITNIINHAKEVLKIDRIHAVIGGFHGIGQSKNDLEWSAKRLLSEDIKVLAPCHCSGSLVNLLSNSPYLVDVAVGTELDFYLF
ncbi:MAG: 7,8-dihydropterin-6-yl-methyl-4-(beta-D-ribofuranosyl)aminobenzene 5-phosphate synthase [bacterium]|nr:MAG: Beta-lactamase domain-containing protein [bacterium 42_11]MDK2871937.1 7,8-dihydropterin-6-yl-methyl-4-(beta-D-ribofuranosyl)aminobenzene 5-phosphate synthase [bacterium]